MRLADYSPPRFLLKTQKGIQGKQGQGIVRDLQGKSQNIQLECIVMLLSLWCLSSISFIRQRIPRATVMLLMLRLMRSIMFIRKAAGWGDQCDWSTPPDSRLAAEDKEATVTLTKQSKTDTALLNYLLNTYVVNCCIPSWHKVCRVYTKWWGKIYCESSVCL